MNRARRARILFSLLAAGVVHASLGAPASAQSAPTAEERAGARAAAEGGTAKFNAGQFAEALDLYTRAEALFHAPPHVLMIGRAQAALGRLVQARESFTRVTREELSPTAPGAFKKAQTDAAQELKELEPKIPYAAVSVSEPGAKGLVVTMDGKTIPSALVGVSHPVDPGSHVFKATADGFVSEEKSLALKQGEKRELKLELRPDASAKAPAGPAPAAEPAASKPPSSAPDEPATTPGNTLRTVGFAAAGVGVAGLIVGGVFAGLSASKRGEANTAFDACGHGCVGPRADDVRALDSDANSKGTIGVIGLAAGGALAIGGVVLILTHPSAKAQKAASVMPWIGANGAGLAGSF